MYRNYTQKLSFNDMQEEREHSSPIIYSHSAEDRTHLLDRRKACAHLSQGRFRFEPSLGELLVAGLGFSKPRLEHLHCLPMSMFQLSPLFLQLILALSLELNCRRNQNVSHECHQYSSRRRGLQPKRPYAQRGVHQPCLQNMLPRCRQLL